jgi:hypothetical protein
MSDSNKSIRWKLIRGAWGSLGEWRWACEDAMRAGWTSGQCLRILYFYHPLAAIFYVMIAVASAVGISSCFGG